MTRAQGAPVIIPETGPAQALMELRADRAISEDRLQDLIHRHPEILPIDDIEPGLGRLIPICRELGTKHGPIDNLLMTVEGNLVMVEAKLWRNPEARRKVIAQALDYASCLFEMDYEDLERAVLRADPRERQRPKRLFDLVSSAMEDHSEEARFVDAVNTNLRRGRIVILVVGDGIRTEIERLASLVQSHAGAHFTFALVELATYGIPGTGQIIVCPRTLGKTTMIERAIVQVSDSRTRIVAPEPKATGPAISSARTPSISTEQFFEEIAAVDARAPDAIKALLRQLEPLGVYEEYKARLILRWDDPRDKQINLGMFDPAGTIRTRPVNWFTPLDISHQYIEELAAAWGLDVNRSHERDWYVAGSNQKAPVLSLVLDKLPLWVPVIERFQKHMRERFVDGGLQFPD